MEENLLLSCRVGSLGLAVALYLTVVLNNLYTGFIQRDTKVVRKVVRNDSRPELRKLNRSRRLALKVARGGIYEVVCELLDLTNPFVRLVDKRPNGANSFSMAALTPRLRL